MASGIADPVAPDAQPADEADPAIDADGLAMVAAEPAERAVERRRVEASDLDARLAQPGPELRRRPRDIAHPVVKHANRDALPRLGGQRVRETLADLVGVDDVILEMDPALRRRDGVKPGRVILGRVAQQTHGVALDQRAAGHAREQPLGDHARQRLDEVRPFALRHAVRS
jgi:hypothetical protein